MMVIKMAVPISSGHIYQLFTFCLALQLVEWSDTCTTSGHVVSCVNEGLLKPPSPNQYQAVTTLDLSHNEIKHIKNGDFYYTQLQKLILSWNSLTYIGNHSFYGLPFVQLIDVSMNNLTLIDAHAFSFLPHLEILDIGSNLFRDRIPDEILNIPTLRILKLASLNRNDQLQDRSLKRGFRYLTNLTQLWLQDMCLEELKNNYFENITSMKLTIVKLNANSLTYIGEETFSNITALETLMLDRNEDLNGTAIEIGLTGLQYTQITSLFIRAVNAFKVIKNTTFMHIRNKTIKQLDLSYSTISTINNFSFKNLSIFDLIMNSIQLTTIPVKTFHGVRILHKLDLSLNDQLRDVTYSLQNLSDVQILTLSSDLFIQSVPIHTFSGMYNLKCLDISYCNIGDIWNGSFYKLPSLETLDISENVNLFNYTPGDFRGLETSLTTLDISADPMKDFGINFCTNFPKLKHLVAVAVNVPLVTKDTFANCLRLEKIELTYCDCLRNISDAFVDFMSLKSLDVSYNDFTEPPMPGAFNVSGHFKSLNYNHVCHNNTLIVKIPQAIEHITHVENLQIMDNAMINFTKKDLKYFDTLKTLRAEWNPFNCSCKIILTFYYWFMDHNSGSNRIVITPGNYICESPRNYTGEQILTYDYQKCLSNYLQFILSISLPICTTVILGVIIGSVVYVKRWTLRYFYYYITVIRRKRNSPDEIEELNDAIIYDLFVSYSYKNLNFVKTILIPVLEQNKNVNGNDEDNYLLNFQQGSDSRKKARYLYTFSQLVVTCLKEYVQFSRPVIHYHYYKKHNKNARHPCHNAGVVQRSDSYVEDRYHRYRYSRPTKTDYKFNIDLKQTRKISKARHTNKVPAFGMRRLQFSKPTLVYKKWFIKYERNIRNLRAKESINKFQISRDRREGNGRENNTPTGESSGPSTSGTTISAFTPVTNSIELDNTENHDGVNVRVEVENSVNSTSQSSEQDFNPVHLKIDMPKYKLMVCHRDFPVGTDLSETIVQYMEKSRKSIALISNDFLNSDWGLFEWEIMVSERNASMLLILIDPNIDKKKMPRCMRSHMKNKLYLEWNDKEDYAKKMFWHKLQRFLGKPIDIIRQEQRNEKYIQARRKTKRQEQANTYGVPIADRLGTNKNVKKERKDVWLDGGSNYVLLTMKDKARILGKYDDGWITGIIINAAMAILRLQFPNIGGLQQYNLAANLAFDSDKRAFVQVLNTETGDELNWIMISSVHSKAGEVKVYDCQNRNNMPEHIKLAIANLLQGHDLKEYKMNLVNTPQNSREADLGIYAVANAVSIIHSVDPASITYEPVAALRNHLCECFGKGTFTLFPMKEMKTFGLFHKDSKEIREIRIVEIHCLCKLPQDGDMSRCSSCAQFYHPNCLGQQIPKSRRFGAYTMLCNDCKSKRANRNENNEY